MISVVVHLAEAGYVSVGQETSAVVVVVLRAFDSDTAHNLPFCLMILPGRITCKLKQVEK